MRDYIVRPGLNPVCLIRKYGSRAVKSTYRVPINDLITVNGGDD